MDGSFLFSHSPSSYSLPSLAWPQAHLPFPYLPLIFLPSRKPVPSLTSFCTELRILPSSVPRPSLSLVSLLLQEWHLVEHDIPQWLWRRAAVWAGVTPFAFLERGI